MPRRKRLKEEVQESTPQKRQKFTRTIRRSTRKLSPQEFSTANENVKSPPSSGKPTHRDVMENASDSSSLSDPPSRINSPARPKSAPIQVTRVTGAKRRPTKPLTQVEKISPKEHEDALNLLIRDDSDDEPSEAFSENAQSNGVARPDLGEDDENCEWEDVDLSKRKQISFEDSDRSAETADLEITLGRTQQSMRIKYSSHSLNLSIRNKAYSAAEKKIRMHTHLLHVQSLLVHGAIRNSWLQDKELQVTSGLICIDIRIF